MTTKPGPEKHSCQPAVDIIESNDTKIFQRIARLVHALAVCSPAIISSVSMAQDDSFKVPSLWQYTAPLITPEVRDTNRSIAQKDPSVVFYQGKWHVFMTVKLKDATRIEYTSFDKWENADAAPRSVLMLADSQYYAAPQVFYFAPHGKWYLVYQLGVPGKRFMQISFSTTTDISDPSSWSPAQSVFKNDEQDPRPAGRPGLLGYLRPAASVPLLHKPGRKAFPNVVSSRGISLWISPGGDRPAGGYIRGQPHVQT